MHSDKQLEIGSKIKFQTVYGLLFFLKADSRKIAKPEAYQILTLKLSGRYILSPLLMLKAE